MQVRAFQTEGKAEQINGVRRFANPGAGPTPLQALGGSECPLAVEGKTANTSRRFEMLSKPGQARGHQGGALPFP